MAIKEPNQMFLRPNVTEVIVSRHQEFGNTLIRTIWTYKVLYIIVGPSSYRLFRRENFHAQKVYTNNNPGKKFVDFLNFDTITPSPPAFTMLMIRLKPMQIGITCNNIVWGGGRGVSRAISKFC